MANYSNEIAKLLDRFQTKVLHQDKSGFFKKELGFKLSLVELLMLKRIAEKENIRISDLVEFLEVDRNLVNTTVKRLVTLKLVAKNQDRDDGRGQCLQLSPAGLVLYEKILLHQSKELAFALSDVTINEEKAILKFMSKMIQYHTDKYEVGK